MDYDPLTQINQPRYKTYKIGPYTTSEKEIIDLTKSWIAISVAFSILLSKATFSLDIFLPNLMISAIAVGLGFLLHELGHKIVAQRYHCFAEFRSQDTMLILAIVMSFLGFILAAPGAVFISGHVSREKNGKISAAGPIVNIILALLFWSLSFIFTNGILYELCRYGFSINAWIGLFNLIPVSVFDGRKILDWNKGVYALVLIIAIGLTFSSFIF